MLPVGRLGTLMRCNMVDLGRAHNDFVKPFSNELERGRSGESRGEPEDSAKAGLPSLRRNAQRCFFKYHHTLVKRYGGSFTREKPYGLEAKILSHELRELGLLAQERYWYITSNAGVPSIESVNNFEVPRDYRIIRTRGKTSTANSETDLFTEWHWATRIMLKDARKINTQYEITLNRLRSKPLTYVEVGSDENWLFLGDESHGYLPDGTEGKKYFLWPESKKKNRVHLTDRRFFVRMPADVSWKTGWDLLRADDRSVAGKLVRTELTLIDDAIDRRAMSSDIQTEKETRLQKKIGSVLCSIGASTRDSPCNLVLTKFSSFRSLWKVTFITSVWPIKTYSISVLSKTISENG